jgi:hypothetical protein
VALFVPFPERIFTPQPPQSVKAGNVNVRLSFFSRMNQPQALRLVRGVLDDDVLGVHMGVVVAGHHGREGQDLGELGPCLGGARGGERQCHDGNEHGKGSHRLAVGPDAAVVDC